MRTLIRSKILKRIQQLPSNNKTKRNSNLNCSLNQNRKKEIIEEVKWKQRRRLKSNSPILRTIRMKNKRWFSDDESQWCSSILIQNLKLKIEVADEKKMNKENLDLIPIPKFKRKIQR